MSSLVEVVYNDKANQRQRLVFPSRWAAVTVATYLIKKGFQAVKRRTIRTDIWLVDADGEVFFVGSKVTAKDAAKWAYEFAGVDREFGVLLWPSGTRLPKHFKVNSSRSFSTAKPLRLRRHHDQT